MEYTWRENVEFHFVNLIRDGEWIWKKKTENRNNNTVELKCILCVCVHTKTHMRKAFTHSLFKMLKYPVHIFICGRVYRVSIQTNPIQYIYKIQRIENILSCYISFSLPIIFASFFFLSLLFKFKPKANLGYMKMRMHIVKCILCCIHVNRLRK